MIPIKKLQVQPLSPDKVRQEYEHNYNESQEWRSIVAEDYDFYLGNQLTIGQKTFLVKQGQPPEANNKLLPAVEQVLANVAASPPSWTVRPRGHMDADFAWVVSQLLRKIYVDSSGVLQFRTAAEMFITKGLSYVYTYPDWNADEGLGALRMVWLPCESMFIDANCSSQDFQSASNMIYSDLYNKESLKVIEPGYADLIDKAVEDYYMNEISGGRYIRDYMMTRADTQDQTIKRVRRFIRHAKVSIPHVRLYDPVTGRVIVVDKDQYEQLVRTEQYDNLIVNDMLREEVTYKTRIRETYVIGDQIAYDEILPLSMYPIHPACNKWMGNPFPAGDVRIAKSPQRMLNRNEAMLISHTSSLGGDQVWYEEGALDASEANKFNMPRAAVRFNPGALSNKKAIRQTPPVVNSELYSEKARYTRDIEQIFGAYEWQQGDAGGAPGTVGEAQIIDEASSRKQNWKMLPMYHALTMAAKTALEWMPHVYSEQRVLRLVNPQGDEQEVTLNETVLDDHSRSVKKIYDMQSLDADVEVVLGSTRARTPMAKLQKNIMLLNAGIYDKIQVIMNIEDEELNKDSLIKRHGELAQLRSIVEELQSQVDMQSGDLQTRERELFHTNLKYELSEATKLIDKAVADLKATTKLEEARQRDATINTVKDLDRLKNTINSKDQGASA